MTGVRGARRTSRSGGHRGVAPGEMEPRGTGGAATAALALLVFGCVFAVTAGPREALATRTQALRQTLAATPPLAQTIVVNATWNGVTTELGAANFGAPGGGNLTAAQLGEITGQLHGDFDRGVVHLAPPGADWAAMTSERAHSDQHAARGPGRPGPPRGHLPAAAHAVRAAGGRPLPGSPQPTPQGCLCWCHRRQPGSSACTWARR